MTDKPNPQRGERFTVLEMGGPTNPSPEELATRIVDIAFKERFTVLEMGGPTNPSPEELATRIVEPLINVGPVTSEPPSAVPPTVQALLAQLADMVGSLDRDARVAAINYAVAELTKRLAS